MAASDDEELVANHAGRMKSPSARLSGIVAQTNLGPSALFNITNPKIVHIGQPFSSKNYQVGILKFCNVISSFPRSSLILRRS